VAENLGTAVLRLEVDDTALREGLAQARRLVENTSAEVGRRSRPRSTSSSSSSDPSGFNERDLVRRFNLRGLTRFLEQLSDELSQINSGRQLNLNTSWGLALEALSDIDVDLRTIGAGKDLNLRSSWNTALNLLQETKEDIDGIAAGKQLNLRSSWNTALSLLQETKENIDGIAAGKQVNLRSSWTRFLSQLEQTKVDIDAASKARQLNLRSSWTKFLGQLAEVKEDLDASAQAAADTRSQRRQAKIDARVDYFSTGGRSTPDAGLLARPNPAAIEAERRLARERLKTADATLKALADERKAGQQRRGRLGNRVGGAVSSGLIGGGFPLLFGQGVGASLGGGIGGVAGGALGGGFGFALSIVGTAVGQAFDEALNKGKTLAAGLEDPIGKFEELRQAGLISSKAVEKSVSSLIAQGREAEAAAKIQLDLSTAFGDTSGLDDLNNAYDELNRSFSQLSVITAKFVAGPLSDFLNKLASSFQVFSARSLFEERLKGASPEVQAEARRRVKQRAAEFSGSGRSLSDVGTEAFSAGLTFLDERLGKTKQVQQAEAAIALAAARQNDLRSLSFRQIEAQVKGYQRLGLELEQQRIEQQRLQDLSVPNADADAINRKAAQDKFTVEQQLNQLTQDRIATQSLEGAQNRLALESVQERISAARQLGSLEEGVARSTLETALNIKASVAEAKRREQEIGAQIDAARIRGGDAGEAEASRLVGEQRVAAEETKLKLIEGATALRDAGVRLRKDLDSAFLNLQKLRTGSGGLNQFLGGQDRARREEDVFQALLPRLRQAQGTFARLTGVRAPEFSGPTSSVNQTILQFIDAVKAEEQALTNTVDTQRALSDNTAALASITGELRTVMGQLTEKNWAVNVSVAADGSSQAYGDVLNGALAS
jgi:hypothetical protein